MTSSVIFDSSCSWSVKSFRIDYREAENLGSEVLPCDEIIHLEDQATQLLHGNHLLRLRADHSREALSGYGES